MTPSEHRRKWSSVPEHRRPIWRPTGVTLTSADPLRERMSLRDALLKLASYYTPASAHDLRAAIRSDWGDASDSAIDRERDQLVRDGELERVGGGWVRVDAVDEDDEVSA